MTNVKLTFTVYDELDRQTAETLGERLNAVCDRLGVSASFTYEETQTTTL